MALAALATLTGQAVAASAHRHMHRADVNKRALVVETIYQYVTVTAGQEPEPEATQFVVDTPPQPAPQPTTMVTAVKAAASPPQPAPPADVGLDLKGIIPVLDKVSSPAPLASPPAPSPPPPAASPAAPSAAPSSAPGGGSSALFSSKRGMAYNDASLANTFGSSCPECSWAYNWASKPGNLDPKYKYVPMCWGNRPVDANFPADAEEAIANGSPALLSFNEPDMPSQSNMSPAVAADLHKKIFKQFEGRVKIGSPAVTNSGDPNQGLGYLKQFMEACNGECAIDFCVVHWYSEAEYSDTLFTHLEKAYEICDKKPIALTEYAPIAGDAAAFVSDVVPKIEALPYVIMHSMFMVSPSSLMSSQQSLSPFGAKYASVA